MRRQITFRARPGDLPEGTFIMIAKRPHLLPKGRCWTFASSGYEEMLNLPKIDCEVLTSKPVVDAMRAGYRPALHPSSAR